MQKQNYELDFTGKDIFSGIDAHLKSWKITIMVDGISYKTFSQDPEARLLENYLKNNFPGGNYYSAYEAGFCGFAPHRDLINHNINNIVINPADVPTTDKEKKQKDDARDSRKIARSLHNNELEAIYVPSMDIEGLRTLVRYRKTLVKEINRYKYRTKSLLYYYGVKLPIELESGSKHWSKRYSNWLRDLKLETEDTRIALDSIIDTVDHLREKLLEINKRLRFLETQGDYADKISFLRTVPGIGLIMSMTIITELENIERFGSIDKLYSYVGLVPRTNSSGENEKVGNITSRSNQQLRSMLIESAWIAIRQDPALMMSYGELRQRMEPNKAIIKIAKKLLSRIKHVLKNNVPYEKGVIK
jgi:transposase